MEFSSPHIVAFADALVAGNTDVTSAAHEVGASAAAVGSPLPEVIEQLEILYSRWGRPPDYDVVKAMAVSWAEVSLARHFETSCDDPVTGLSTLVHLRSRLDELFRVSERTECPVNGTHALVVVEAPYAGSTNPLEKSLALLEVGEILRTVYNGDETIAQLSVRRVTALVELERIDDSTLALLHVLLRPASVEQSEPRLWVERLPFGPKGISDLLRELAR